MKLIVERDVLDGALSSAIRASRSAGDNPLLRNILLTPADDQLGIAAASMSMRIDAPIGAEIEKGEALTVQGDALASIVGTLPAGSQITLSWKDENFVALECGGARYKLLALPAENFPAFTQTGEIVTFPIKGVDFAGAFRAVQMAISRDETRPFLTGVCVQAESKKHPTLGNSGTPQLGFIATTYREFGRCALPLPEEAAMMPNIIVPRAMVDEIIRQCGRIESDVMVSVSDNLIRVATPGATITSKLVASVFPEYHAGLPAENRYRVSFLTAQMTAALSRILCIGDLRHTQIEVKSGHLLMTAIGKNGAEAQEIVEADTDRVDLTLGISAQSFLTVLGGIETPVCFMSLGEGLAHIILNPNEKGDADYRRTYLTTQLLG